VGGPSAWCEGNHFKVGGPGPGNEIFLAELSQSLVLLHICLSEVDEPVPTRPPGSSIYDCYPVAKSRQDHHGSQSELRTLATFLGGTSVSTVSARMRFFLRLRHNAFS